MTGDPNSDEMSAPSPVGASLCSLLINLPFLLALVSNSYVTPLTLFFSSLILPRFSLLIASLLIIIFKKELYVVSLLILLLLPLSKGRCFVVGKGFCCYNRRGIPILDYKYLRGED